MTTASPSQDPTFAPYGDPGRDSIYNLLFCDDLEAYRASMSGELEGPWRTLFARQPDIGELQRIATDPLEESRIRVLACRKLKDAQQPLAQKQLLGVIIENAMPEGLDVLAAYPDHRARYLNHAGKALIWEASDPAIDALIDRVLDASEQVVARIGPWDKARLPPPGSQLRLTFLVSDAIYFGQGPFDSLAHDAIGGPVVSAATQLLSALVEKSTQ